MDESLEELRVDHVDAYYLMASYNPSLIESDEVYRVWHCARRQNRRAHAWGLHESRRSRTKV